jgi:hypothetical protein
MRFWGVVLITGVVGSFLGGSLAVGYIYDHRKPDYQEMRSYVISRLSDDQIRRACEAAQIQHDKEYASEKQHIETSRREKAEKCFNPQNDIAFRERHAWECSTEPEELFAIDPMVPSVHQYYEDHLMGFCGYVRTVREAKAHNCLPR